MSVPTKTTDTALLQRWTRRRDADAFAELVARHGGMVYGACRRVLGDAHEAEDAAQESFIELMRARRPVTSSLPGWLHTVAVRRSLDRLKQAQRRRKRQETFAAKAGAAVEVDPDDLLAIVDEVIAEQPESYRAPIVLRFLEGKTHTEIGAQLGIAESTVRHRIEKGVEQGRESLRKRGVVVGAGVLAAALEGQSAQAAPARLVAVLGRTAVSGTVPAAAGGLLGAGFWGLLTKAMVALVIVGAVGVTVWTVTGYDSPSSPNIANVSPESETSSASPETSHDGGSQREPEGPDDGRSVAAASGGAAAPAVAAAADEKGPPAVSGRVYDKESGAGVPGARVMVWEGASGIEESGPANADGYYEIRDLAPGIYRFTPRAGKAYPGTQHEMGTAVTVEAGNPITGLDFALKRGIRVAGQVVDTSGTPVKGADVRVRTKESPNPEYAETNEAGAFETYLEAPSEALYVCAFSTQMFGQIVEGLSLPSHGVGDITVTLDIPRTASVAGTVVDPQGRPMKGLKLHLRTPETEFSPPHLGSHETAANGRFTLTNLIPGKYDLGLTPQDTTGWMTSDVAARFELAKGERIQGLRIVYGEKGGLAISGVVVDTAGKPIHNVRVTAFGRNQETTHTDANGRFVVTGLEEGAYHLNTDHDDYSMGGKGGVAAGTADVEIILEGKGGVRGRVTDASTGNPVHAFEVCFINGAHATFRPEMLQNKRTFGDASGEYELTGIYAGPVTVTVRANGYAASYQPFTILENETVEADFVLEPAEPLIGKVLDPDGNPVRDAFVFLPGASVSTLHLKYEALAQTDRSGAFQIEGLPGGTEAIAAYAWPLGPTMAPVPGNGEPVILTLPEAGILEGRVLATPQKATSVHARHRDLPAFFYYLANVEPDNTFRLTGLAPGELEVQAIFGRMNRWTKGAAIVASGQTTALDIVFEDGTAEVSGTVTVGGHAPDVSSILLEVTTASGVQGYQLPGRDDGAFHFEGVAAGSGSLKVYVAPKENPVATEQREVTFDIAPGETIKQNIAF